MLSSSHFSKPIRDANESSITSRCALSIIHPPASSNVYLRIKPSLEASEEIYALPDSTTLHVRRNVDKRYMFTRIFDGDTSQADFFYESVRRQVIHLLLGESSTVITYGASNTGKTYTLYGTPGEPGAIPRSIQLLFSAINCTLAPWYKVVDDNTVIALDEPERTCEIFNKTRLINPSVIAKEEYAQARLSLDNSNPRRNEERDLWSDECVSSVWISVAEIHNDNVYDLLVASGHEQQERRPLKLTTRRDGSTFVNGLKFVHVTTALEACQLLILVRSRMTVAPSAASNSHTIFALKLLKYEKENRPETVRVSTLTFCDVAGSRRVKSRDDTRLAESRNINNSLLVLGRCLKTLRDSYSSGDHVAAGPFRESKLTRMLQKVLTGREKFSFVVTVDIGADAFAETLSVLNFSAMAKRLGESRASRRTTNTTTATTITTATTTATTTTMAATPRNAKSSTLIPPPSPRKTITIDLGEYEDLKRGRGERSSKQTQSDVSFHDYDRLRERNRELRERVEVLEEGNLNWEYEIRRELVDRYSAAIEELESCWRRRVQDIEDEGKSLLKWSVCQVESFYRERIDSLMESRGASEGCGKKRKREEGGEGSIRGDLETENAVITSKVVALREVVRDLRAENELLATDRNKCNFELVLTRERLKGFHDLIRAHFPELFLKLSREDGSDIGWLVYELKRILDEKTEDIESLENNLSRASEDYVKMVTKTIDTEKELRETRSRLQEVLLRAKDFENEVKEKTNLANDLQLQLQLLRKELVEIRECESGYVTLKSVGRGRNTVRSNFTRKYVCSDDLFSSDNNSDNNNNNNNNNAELVVVHVGGNGETDRCSLLDDNYDHDYRKFSPIKKVSAMESDLSDRHTFRSSDSGIKEDSGIDFSCASRRSTGVNDPNSIVETARENFTQTDEPPPLDREKTGRSSDRGVELERYVKQREEEEEEEEEEDDDKEVVVEGGETSYGKESSRGASGTRSMIDALKRIADFNKSELSECKKKLLSCEAKMAELEEENEKLARMVEIDTRRYNERINELTDELLVKEEDDNRSLNKLENCLKKCAYLEDRLTVLHSVHERTLKYFARRKAEEIDAGRGGARDEQPCRLQRLRERIDEFEIVVEKCKEERDDYRVRLEEQLETQSMLEAKLKWLSTEIRSRDDQLVSLKMEMDGIAVANESNDEKVKCLGEEIGRSGENVRRASDKLAYFEEARKYLEEALLNNNILENSRTNFGTRDSGSRIDRGSEEEEEEEEEDELCKIKLQLRENEREMDSLRKHRNDVVKKYECTVQKLRIEIERMRKKLSNLQKLLLTNFAGRYRRFLDKRREKRTTIFQLRKLTALGVVEKEASSSDEESSLPIVERSIASPRYANSRSSVKNPELDTDIDAYESEESYRTESSLGLNERNVDACQIQSDASDCSEVRCGCGIGFKNARRHGRMSGWMKVRGSCANTCLLRRQLDGTGVEQG